MRFGRRTRNWVAGSRLFGERDSDDNGAVASDERHALLATEEYDGSVGGYASEVSPEVSDSIHAIDPTQRLLTALGRFQRQVVKAEKGLPQAEWCDECMNQLITGIEIAYEQDWPDVQQALTDTARILHSYEQARSAEAAVSFLQDSYEILCLMVGDLIVDNVRSGVMQKWQERYRAAVAELSEAGIPLVEDEEGEDAAPAEARPHEAPAHLPEHVDEAPEAEEAFDPFGDDAFEPVVEQEEDFFRTPGPLSGTSPSEEPAETDEVEEFVEMEEAQEESVAEALALEEAPSAELSGAEAPVSAEEYEDESQLPPLDELLEDSSAQTASEDLPPAEDLDTAPEASASVEAKAQEELEEPEDESRAETSMAAQEFEEVVVEEEIIADAPPAAAKVMEQALQAEPAPAEDGTPDAMLQTIRRAFAAGNVAEAKMYALQVAADMAQLEADRAEERRALKQRFLEENAGAIAAGEEQVCAAESGVSQAEARVQEREQDQGAKRMEIEALRTQSAEHESEISRLDEEIRRLQALRELEEQRLNGVQEDLERALAEDSRLQTDIESLQDAWNQAQDALTKAQALVARLRQEREEEAVALAEAEQTVAEHERAVHEIARTIGAITGKPVAETPADEAEAPDSLEEEAAADSEAPDAPADAAEDLTEPDEAAEVVAEDAPSNDETIDFNEAEPDADLIEDDADESEPEIDAGLIEVDVDSIEEEADATDDGQISLLEHLEKEEADARAQGKAKAK